MLSPSIVKDFEISLITLHALNLQNHGQLVKNNGTPNPRLLGGSWVVISGLTSTEVRCIANLRILITPLTTTHEPPSRP